MSNSQNNPVPMCRHGSGHFEVSDNGVYFFGKDKNGNDEQPLWICSALYVTAKTRDDKGHDWGRLLEWQDDDGNAHQWAMPIELLEGDGTAVRTELARLGLQIAPSLAARNHLMAYLKVWPVSDRARCVDRLGWQGGVFVTPTEALGAADERMVFQNQHAIEPSMSTAGSVEQWRDNVARLAQGNSRLMFAISLAFAAPLADIVGEDSGGFHLRGGSSTGKSTALKMAASVWGQPSNYVRNWRSTTNGLEGLAVLHNDGLLILDEISQIDPGAAGDAAYMLANGQGKARANRNAMARAAFRWQLLFLSAGEESLSAIMERAGKKASAGQEIRLAEIEADAGAGMGLFEELHAHPNAATLATALSNETKAAYGAVGQEWLSHLVANRSTLAAPLLEQMRQFVNEVVPHGAHGQIVRVARRFALVAIAGELATHYGLTGWRQGEAAAAVKTCFITWLEGFGGAENQENRAILSQALVFLETHGASRFEDISTTNEIRVPNRVGFFRTGNDGHREFLVTREAFLKDICQGHNSKTVIAVLREAGVLIPGNDDKPSQVARVPGLGTCRVYVLRYVSGG